MYVKAEIADGVEIKVKISPNNLFSSCCKCGKETPCILWDLLEDVADGNVYSLKEGAAKDLLSDDAICEECFENID